MEGGKTALVKVCPRTNPAFVSRVGHGNYTIDLSIGLLEAKVESKCHEYPVAATIYNAQSLTTMG